MKENPYNYVHNNIQFLLRFLFHFYVGKLHFSEDKSNINNAIVEMF